MLSLDVVVETWFGCAMVGVSSWVAKWCGKTLALWLLSVLGVPFTSIRSLVVDNIGATYAEDGSHASRCPSFHVLCLRYAAEVLQSGEEEMYVPVHHNSGS